MTVDLRGTTAQAPPPPAVVWRVGCLPEAAGLTPLLKVSAFFPWNLLPLLLQIFIVVFTSLGFVREKVIKMVWTRCRQAGGSMPRAQSTAMAWAPHCPPLARDQGRTPCSAGSSPLQCLHCCCTQHGVQTASFAHRAVVQGSEKSFSLTRGLGG